MNPDVEDTWYDGVDSDCDGASDYDQDADGHDRDLDGGLDCDDEDAAVNPDAEEVCNDGLDNDCDGTPPATAPWCRWTSRKPTPCSWARRSWTGPVWGWTAWGREWRRSRRLHRGNEL